MPSSDDPIDVSFLPSVLPPSQRRVNPETGLPTKPLLDQEESTRYFFGQSLLSAQRQLTEVTATVGDVTGTVSEIVSVVQNSDGTLTAGKLTTVSTATATNTASITDLTTSVGAISVRKTVTATLNGSTGFYELSGVQNGDGSGPVFTMAFQANNFLLTDPSYGGGAPQNVFSYSGTYGAFFFNVPVVFNGAAIFNGTVNTAQLTADAVTTKYDVPKQSDHNIYPVATGPTYTAYAVIQEAGVPIQGTFTVTQDTPIEVSVNPAIFYQQAAFKLAVFKNGVYEAPMGIYLFSGTGANFCGTSSDTSGVQGSIIYKSVLTPGTWTLDVRVSQLGNVIGQSQTRILAGTRITMLATKR